MSKLNDSQSNNQITPPQWSDYYEAVANRPPRETLIVALRNFEGEVLQTEPRIAIDLGCGEGRDTVELLRQGWKVIAIDGQQEAIERLLNRPKINSELLETRVAQFENLELPESVDYINASFCLPLCKPDNFVDLWKKIVSSLISGGRFSGHFFGSRDSWANDPTKNHHTLSELKVLLKPFEVELLKEEEHAGKTALGVEKYWHIFHIVARKK